MKSRFMRYQSLMLDALAVDDSLPSHAIPVSQYAPRPRDSSLITLVESRSQFSNVPKITVFACMQNAYRIRSLFSCNVAQAFNIQFFS